MHPLTSKHLLYDIELPHPYAAVIAVWDKKNLVVQDRSLMLVKTGAKFAPLIDTGLQVISEDGEPIQPTGTFYISPETLDPHHLIIDWFRPNKVEDQFKNGV